MADYEEVIRATGACIGRLWRLESSFVSTDSTAAIPATREFMSLMDSVQRAQFQFEKALMDAGEDDPA
ncbi:hypothetical protein [Saccharopolyspora sp. NPDC002376]